jgi:hypothetical protein
VRDKQSDDHCREKKETARNRFRWPRPQHPPIAGSHLIDWLALELSCSRRSGLWQTNGTSLDIPLPFRRHDSCCSQFRWPALHGRSRTKRFSASPASIASDRHGWLAACRRKFFYLFTCEYCFSHYVAAVFLTLTRFQMLYTGWRGYVVSLSALVWVSNQYMSIYSRLRLDIKHENLEIKAREGDVERRRAA